MTCAFASLAHIDQAVSAPDKRRPLLVCPSVCSPALEGTPDGLEICSCLPPSLYPSTWRGADCSVWPSCFLCPAFHRSLTPLASQVPRREHSCHAGGVQVRPPLHEAVLRAGSGGGRAGAHQGPGKWLPAGHIPCRCGLRLPRVKSAEGPTLFPRPLCGDRLLGGMNAALRFCPPGVRAQDRDMGGTGTGDGFSWGARARTEHVSVFPDIYQDSNQHPCAKLAFDPISFFLLFVFGFFFFVF